MGNRDLGLARVSALVLVTASALGAFGWFWWSAAGRSDVSFLPRLAPAAWIVYPSTPQGRLHPDLEMATVFRRSFRLGAVPLEATVGVAGFHRYSLAINGAALPAPTATRKNWKQPDCF